MIIDFIMKVVIIKHYNSDESSNKVTFIKFEIPYVSTTYTVNKPKPYNWQFNVKTVNR